MNKKNSKISWVSLFNLLFFLLLIIASIFTCIIIIFLIVFRFSWGYSSIQPIWPIPLVVVFIIALGAMIQVALQIVRLLGKREPLFSKAKRNESIYSGVVMTIAIGIIGFFGFVFYSFQNEKPPQFFPFDDPEATYIITKRDTRYTLIYNSSGDRNAQYVCDQMSGVTNCRTEINNNIETMIGNSPVELEPYVGKRVKVTGEFVYSDKQCIAEKCREIGSWAVLNIHSLRELTDEEEIEVFKDFAKGSVQAYVSVSPLSVNKFETKNVVAVDELPCTENPRWMKKWEAVVNEINIAGEVVNTFEVSCGGQVTRVQ